MFSKKIHHQTQPFISLHSGEKKGNWLFIGGEIKEKFVFIYTMLLETNHNYRFISILHVL